MAAKRKGTAAVESAPHDEWKLREDVRSLARAEAIKKDPDYHKKVKAHAKTMLKEHKQARDESQAAIDLAEDD